MRGEPLRAPLFFFVEDTMLQIEVGLKERAYPICIGEGLLREVGMDLKNMAIGNRYFIVADCKVAALYGKQLLTSLDDAGISAKLITFPAGEAHKNLSTITELASQLALLGVDRKDALIALGGGVTGDITGFLAAIYMRGIPFVQIPTSLLAQVDSSVGGKTGVDLPEGKNLVGCFYQPRFVSIDTQVLTTLPRSELLNGIAEIIKYGVIYDRKFFHELMDKRQAILDLDLKVLAPIIKRCCEVKAEVVAADEKEADLRRILNFGHTIGHAVEAASDFVIAHGHGVAIGMVAAAEIAVEKGIFSREEAGTLRQLLLDFGLPVSIPGDLDHAAIRGYMAADKKSVGGKTFFVLPEIIGKVIITDDVQDGIVDKVIARLKTDD